MSNSVVLGKVVHNPSAEFQYPKAVITVPEHPSSMALIEHWRAHEGRGGMCMGRDIPSRAISKLLSNIAICEPEIGWADARIRLAGSILTERFGRNITGMRISELYESDPEAGRMLVESARQAQEMRQPGLLSTRVVANNTEVMRFEVVALPIFAPDGFTPWCLVGIFRF
jgi:hypothetical protein